MVAGPTSIAWLPAGLLVGAGAGLVATLAMDRPMNRLPEGTTPPQVAAGTLSGTPLDRAPSGVATAVHYAAGIGTGVLFVAGVALAIRAVGRTAAVVLPVAAALFVLMNGFFSFVVVPVYGRVPDARVGAVRRDWALSAAAYLVVASALVALALSMT